MPSSHTGAILQPDQPRMAGPYRILNRIGAGGMGVVYRAVDDADRRVAVKIIRDEYADDPEFRQRFAREVDACKRVAGKCTARVLGADATATAPYLATEYIAGPSLGEYVAAHGPLPSDALHALAVGLAEAVAAIHATGLVHRDLKPSNVLLSDSGPKVIDFGIAAAADATAVTRSGLVLGSPGWMAPEQVEAGSRDPAVDVYCWGLLVAYAATGRFPFGEGRPEAVLYRIVHGEPDLTGIHPDLRSVLVNALARDPQRRPTAEQLLTELLGGAPVDPGAAVTVLMARNWTHTLVLTSTLRPAITGDSAPKPGRRRRRRAVAIVAAVVAAGVAAGGAAFAFAHNHDRGAQLTAVTHQGVTPAAVTTTAPSAATPTAAAEVVATKPTLHRTQVTLYNPFAVDGSPDGLTVAFRTTGTCTDSIADPRPDAYRCFLDENEANGGNIEDPCFASGINPKPYLLCTHDPSSTEVVKVRPSRFPNSRYDETFNATTATPWFLVLANGSRCGMITGATGVVAGMRLNYGCTGGGVVYGDPDRAGTVWRVFYAPSTNGSPREVKVAQAFA